MEKCSKCWYLKSTPKSKCFCNKWEYTWPKTMKIQKPIAQISEKKQERIKEEWSELEFFKKIFLKLKKEWENKCVICWKKVDEDNLSPSCFPHILPKWKYPEFRYLKNNIWFVCWISHHAEFDRIVNIMKKNIWLYDFEQIIRDWKRIDVKNFIEK